MCLTNRDFSDLHRVTQMNNKIKLTAGRFLILQYLIPKIKNIFFKICFHFRKENEKTACFLFFLKDHSKTSHFHLFFHSIIIQILNESMIHGLKRLSPEF